MTWVKGKTFRRNGKIVRYIYKNGRKSTKRLVTVRSRKKRFNYRRRRY
jgi:hypothetical protein